MFKRGKLLMLCVALSALSAGANQAWADITVTPITAGLTVISPYLYISINNIGTLGNGSDFPGIQHDPTGTGSFADGKDYLTPGIPFEGFYINATNGSTSYSVGNNNSGITDFASTGTLTDSSTLHNANISWVGSNSSIGMTVANRYTFSDASQYIKIRTTLTATQNLTGVQFLRTLDPDQDSSADLGASRTPSTTNTLGFTTSTGRVIPASDAAVAAGAVRPDLKVIIYTNSTVPHAAGINYAWQYSTGNNPADYLGATPLNDGNGDNAIGIAYNVGTLAAGSSTDLVYYYLFTDSDAALSSLIESIITGSMQWKQYMIDNGGNQNAQSAGGVLDTINALDAAGQTNLAQQYLIDNFAASDPASYVQLATALSGEIHAAVAAEVPLSSIWLQNTVSDLLYKSSTSDSCKQPGRSAWFATGRSWDKWYGDSKASGIAANRNQFAIGYDLVANNSVRAGVGGFYASVNVDDDNLSSGGADKTLAFAYGQYSAGKVLLDGIVAAGSTNWTTSRAITLNGNTDVLNTAKSGFSGLIGLSVGVPMIYRNISIQPYASALFIHEDRGSVTEGSAATALSLPGYSLNGTRVGLGVSLASACRNPVETPTTFKLNVEGGIDSAGLANPAVDARLAGIPYTIVSPSVSEGYFQTKAEGTVRFASNGYCYADYIGTFRSGGNSQGVELGVRFIF
jgi:hypothetical protein